MSAPACRSSARRSRSFLGMHRSSLVYRILETLLPAGGDALRARRVDPSSDGATVHAQVAQRALHAARALGTTYLPAVPDHVHVQGVGVLGRHRRFEQVLRFLGAVPWADQSKPGADALD